MAAGAGGPNTGVTSLILPTYNPGRFLARTWNRLQAFLAAAPAHENWEVLFACDGCTDGTTEQLEKLTAAEHNRVRILSYKPNRGKGFAVREGLTEARGRWRIFTDVDLSYGLDGVRRVAEQLWAGADVVVGSRGHPDSRMELPFSLQDYVYRRRIQSAVYSALVRWLLPLTFPDPQAGLKGLSLSAVRRVLPSLRCPGFAFDCELLLACRNHGFSIVEVPVLFQFLDGDTTTSVRGIGRMLRELWRIRRDWRRKPAPEAEILLPVEQPKAA